MKKYQDFSIATIIVSTLMICQTNAFLVWPTLRNLKVPVCNVRSRADVSTMMRFDDFEDSAEDEDDDDDFIDDEALGNWRSFRKDLLETGLTSPEPSQDNFGDSVVSGASKKAVIARPKSVSKQNEKLLMQQNEELAEEYLDGVWAHEAPTVEVGGLVVRLPLEAEIYRTRESTMIGKELQQRIDIDGDGGGSRGSLLSGREEEGAQPKVSFDSLVAAQTLLWYKKSQLLIDEYMDDVAKMANERGEIDPSDLEPQTENLLRMYLDVQESWQEVCLVLDRDSSKGTATTIGINRPMAFSVSKDLARLILFGASATLSDSILSINEGQQTDKFLRAFDSDCAVYVGGPDKMDEPATIIHGFAELEGAVEISQGSGIYKGGLDDAMEGIMNGKYKPLDFRFFVGQHKYKDGDLDVAVHMSKYSPIACARSLALKQCIQLPKPLWHEVCELCGGELKEISKLELMKRNDIEFLEE